MRADFANGASPRILSCGFTLIEVLVVLVIIVITAAFVVPNMARDARARIEEDGERLTLVLEHARIEAATSGQALAWNADAAGYRFLRRDRGRWAAVGEDEILAPRAWSRDVALSALDIAGTAASGGLLFSASGLNLPYDVVLAAGPWRLVLSSDALGRVAMGRARIVENPQ